jgi:secreted Zn-dependent insulinase-like peptidase
MINLQSDEFRLEQLLQTLAHPHSEFHRFSHGNMESLKQPRIRDLLLEFYHRHYSSALMKLAVLGNRPLDELEQLALECF